MFGGKEGHGVGFSCVDSHTAAFAPFLAGIDHSLEFEGVTAHEDDVVQKGHSPYPGGVWVGGRDCIREFGTELSEKLECRYNKTTHHRQSIKK